MCHGPVQPITFSKNRGPVRPINFSKVSGRPGHHMAARPMRHGLYMGWLENSVGRPVDLTGWAMGRPMCFPVLKGACACADVIFLRYVVVGFSLVFPRLDSVGQLLSAHETHIASTHYSHISAPPTIRSDGFMWVTTSSSCSTPAAAAAQQEHVPLQHPVLLQNTLLHYPLYSKYNASTSSDILAAASHAYRSSSSPHPRFDIDT